MVAATNNAEAYFTLDSFRFDDSSETRFVVLIFRLNGRRGGGATNKDEV